MNWKNRLGWILLCTLVVTALACIYIGGGITAFLVIVGCLLFVALLYLSIWLIAD